MKSPFKKSRPTTDTAVTPEESGKKKIKLGKPNLSKPKGSGGLGKPKTKAKGKKVGSKPKKPAFDSKKFMAEVNSLNGQNYGSAPLPVKIFILAMMLAIILVLAWLLLISKKLDEIKQAENQQVGLLESYKEKESKARHLQAYEAQVAQMETDFADLLAQLPIDTRVPELVDGINMVGSGSGVRFQDISVQPEVEQEFFIEQPIQIIGLGDYHQFGSFVSGIAALPRIITMHDFEIKNPQPSLDRMPELQLVLQTKTYRAKDDVDLNATAEEVKSTEGEGK
ncbi:type 4a pilus biogenesis protein PilO [Moraxella bovis]|uniref:Pilus assembly protein, PilO n=1 Tax=Moraxella bovis TaxID=476 RepID=A0A378PNL3_MORBO|nr:type 4a pilus biogenesis protein PilO [Moraxella bovis]UYZ67998.1 type 4a pilus biogenesis protein PilO [Moraxella bovis]UYZ70373.1 type 4a pilus biogenesis protein PilO [Moraxella bovis]UYZ73707.1 type 4a pilus biogenesis protein PilO [Moraxella bovis]UYZ75237.1 type 4a pilus biogenesis protein PilO [Moraxella bovis]UYZ78831.1 type 4a pilus biogenesis protein PilO [Moraxella bovis]